MSSILVVDVGNSRMTWGLARQHTWISQGVVPNTEIGTLALRNWQNLPRPARAVGVNVAGEAARVRVEGQLARWRVTMEWITPTEVAGGVVNRYTRPAQLGADRWAALIAARRRIVAAELFPRPCVVVNAGTAVTVDALDAEGVFRGGIILPGLRLMLDALAENTAALKVPPGANARIPHQYAGCPVLRRNPRRLRRDRADALRTPTGRLGRDLLPRGRRGAGDRAAPRRVGGGRG